MSHTEASPLIGDIVNRVQSIGSTDWNDNMTPSTEPLQSNTDLNMLPSSKSVQGDWDNSTVTSGSLPIDWYNITKRGNSESCTDNGLASTQQLSNKSKIFKLE